MLTREAVSTVKSTEESGAVIEDNEHTIDDIPDYQFRQDVREIIDAKADPANRAQIHQAVLHGHGGPSPKDVQSSDLAPYAAMIKATEVSNKERILSLTQPREPATGSKRKNSERE